jgi:hypothetical protein
VSVSDLEEVASKLNAIEKTIELAYQKKAKTNEINADSNDEIEMISFFNPTGYVRTEIFNVTISSKTI